MATKAYPLMRELADGWEKLYPSAVCSGIVGDARHSGGYHKSRKDNPRGNYSVVRTDDRTGMGPADASAGIDMSMNRRDMVLCTARLERVWANKNDPRRKFLNAFNGWDGSGDATRYDVVAGTTQWATPDHRSHVHAEARRRWVLTRAMVVGILSALAGETVAQYMRRIGVKPAPVAAPVVPKPVPTPGRKPVPKPVAKPKPVQVPKYPGRVLRRNDHQTAPDPALRVWQARVRARGWTSVGTADGMFGPRTERVVRRFQQLCHVGVDGQIGPVTWPLPWTRALGS